MNTLSGVLTLGVAPLAQTTIKPVPAAGLPGPAADRVELAAALARRRAVHAELAAKHTVPSDYHVPGKIAHAGFFNETWSLQDR